MAPETQSEPLAPTAEQREWLASQFDSLTTRIDLKTPSEWAEQRRYLPESVTPLPGFYRFEVAPYLREIVDCLGVDSPVREVAVMKGIQICFTTGVMENLLGYFIDEIKTAPVMWVTATGELVQQRLALNITPMLIHSELEHLIKSGDINNPRKTGKTDRLTEWVGGGCLIPLGAQNPDAFRQQPAQVLLGDEIDAWPVTTKNQGNPVGIVRARTNAYEVTRKILWGSSPTLVGMSQIVELFKQGDQRRYFVCCLGCGKSQTLRWSRTNNETGEQTGIVWDLDDRGRLVPGSVRYLCQECGHPHTNDDKTKLLSPEYGAEWRPTAMPAHPDFRSYHIPALLSPVGMQSWESCVIQYLKGWDQKRNAAKDLGAYQVFYNSILGETFEPRGSGVKLGEVSPHRRSAYRYGQIPNKWARDHCGGPVLLLTCTVDVQKRDLAVAVFGWCKYRRAILVDYWRFEGETERIDDPDTWGRLREFLTSHVYEADDGRRYRPVLTLIDSGYLAPQVYDFCHQFDSQIYPSKGVDVPPKAAGFKEFSDFRTPHGQVAFNVYTDHYKTRLVTRLRREWDGQGTQPNGHFNVPIDATDEQLKELTRERKRPRVEAKTGKRIGWEWYRTSGAANELWDLLVYAECALDIVAWDFCRTQLGLDETDWEQFWHHAAESV